MVRPRFSFLGFLTALLIAGALALGVVFVHSSTEGTDLDGLGERQLQAIAVALPVCILLALVPIQTWLRHWRKIYVLGLIGLVLVFVIGIELNYSRRWLRGPAGFMLQPSEFARVALIVALAGFLREVRRPGLLAMGGVVALAGIPFLLVQQQPDLGTALTYLPIAAVMLFVAGLRWRWTLSCLALAAVAIPAVWSSPFLHEYQRERIRTFQTSIPELAAQALEARRSGDLDRAQQLGRRVMEARRGAGQQSYSAQIAIGSGGAEGLGLGQGPHNRLNYLPVRHSDFLFAVIGEEWGFRGTTGVVAMYAALGILVLGAGAMARDRGAQLVCAGVATALCQQAFANVGMNIGLLPVTGLPLPFLSQGGSSTLASLACAGLALSAARTGHAWNFVDELAGEARDPFGGRELSQRALRE